MLLKWFPALSYLSGMISLGRGLVMFIMLMIFFTAIYTALPHREALDLRPDPGSHVFRRRMGTHFPGIFRLLPVFRHIRCHVRKFDCGDPFYAVALCLDLHPVCGGGDQLVFAVL